MISVNLIPQSRREAGRRRLRLRRWVWICVAYAVLVLSGAAMALATWGGSVVEDLRPRIAAAETQLADVRATDQQLGGELEELSSRLAAAQQVGQRPDWSVLMAVVSRASDERIVLRRVYLRPREVPREAGVEPTFAGYAVQISGVGTDQAAVSAFVLKLEESGLFDQVQPPKTSRGTFRGKDAIAFETNGLVTGREDRP